MDVGCPTKPPNVEFTMHNAHTHTIFSAAKSFDLCLLLLGMPQQPWCAMPIATDADDEEVEK